MLVTKPYEPNRGLASKLHRRLVQWRNAAPINFRPDKPVLSLTFDDCPSSAAILGTRILDRHNIQGCFYIATNLMGEDTVMGRIADRDEVRAIYQGGHEIGAHTHSHCDCAKTASEDVFADIERNLAELDPLTNGNKIHSFAYPFGETTYELKQKLARHFKTLRGVLPGHNRGLIDRAHFRSYEIDGSEARMKSILGALEASAITPSWIIMFTHDVAETPSGYGITPDQLETIIARAQALGVEIMSPSEVAKRYSIGKIGS